MKANVFAFFVLLVAALLLFGCTSQANNQMPTDGNDTTPTAEIDITPGQDTTPDNGTVTPPAEEEPAASETVRMENWTFKPDTVTISAGGKVVWYNSDSAQHTATSDTGLFDSGLLPKGTTFEYTFNTPGTYTYHCTPHPQMTGTVIVK